MWLLEDQDGKIRYLKPGKTYTFGRKQADFVLEGDLSISRNHATITTTLKEQTRTSEVSSTCTVKDVSSKYGTVIMRNDVQMRVPTDGLELEPGDSVKFGLQRHVFVAKYIHIVSVISRLNTKDKKLLKDIMDSIGGLVIDCYDDNCTHLTATTATSTSKIISALIAGIPIVGINYWTSVLNAVNADKNLPDPNSFILPLQDKGLDTQRISLKPNPSRKTLFQGKTFIFFLEKTYKEYKKMIKDAGGKIELFKITAQCDIEQLLTDNAIIMQTTESMTKEFAVFDEMLYSKMQTKNLRMITEAEIPLAIIYVSLSQYCNPKFNFKQLIQRKSFKEDTSEVLALDTQDVLTSNSSNDCTRINTITVKNVLIPESQDVMPDNIFNSENDGATNDVNCNKEEPKESNDNDKKKKLLRSTSSKVNKMEIEDNLKNLGFSSNLQIKKTKIALDVPGVDDFEILEKQRGTIKRKKDDRDRKENKLVKLGFKRSEKKTFDFDLDDVDMEEPKEKIIKEEVPTQDTNREVKNDVKSNNKLFKKVYKNIPVTRVALSDMTVWRRNI